MNKIRIIATYLISLTMIFSQSALAAEIFYSDAELKNMSDLIIEADVVDIKPTENMATIGPAKCKGIRRYMALFIKTLSSFICARRIMPALGGQILGPSKFAHQIIYR